MRFVRAAIASVLAAPSCGPLEVGKLTVVQGGTPPQPAGTPNPEVQSIGSIGHLSTAERSGIATGVRAELTG